MNNLQATLMSVAKGDRALIKIDCKHHKIIKSDTPWGVWSYTYHERYHQECKAQKICRRGHC
jgi:hypothetical protein